MHCYAKTFNKTQITLSKKKSTEPEQVIATTLLQSRLLIGAGLSACTADMRWNLSVTFWGKLMQIAGIVPNLPDRPDLIIAALTNVICEQLENGGIIHNLNL